MLNESIILKFGNRLPELLLRVHHDRAVPSNGLLDRLARHQQESNPLVPCLHHDLVSAVEEYQRMIADVVHRPAIGFRDMLSQYRARIRGVAERAGAREHVGKRVTRSVDVEPFPLTSRHKNVEVIRIGSYSFHRPLFAPEFTTHDSHASAVVVSHLGYRARRNILVARIGHLQRRGQVGPELEAVHPAMRISLRHLLVENAAAGSHPLNVTGGDFSIVAHALAGVDPARAPAAASLASATPA